MRFSTFAVTLLSAASLTSATTLFGRQSSPYPNCALPCLTSANTGSCVSTDYRCLCTSQSFVASTTQCITGACQGADLQTALKTASDVCASVGVTLTSTPVATATSAVSKTSTSTTPGSSSTSVAKSSASKISGDTILGLGAAALVAFCL